VFRNIVYVLARK